MKDKIGHCKTKFICFCLAGLIQTACDGHGPTATAPAPASAATPPATPPREDARMTYELNQRCGHDARDWFDKTYGATIQHENGISSTLDYINHYNAKLRQCVAEVHTFSWWNHPKNKSQQSMKQSTLVLVNENRDMGHMIEVLSTPPHFMQCQVADSACTSEAEWDALAHPYLND